VFKDTLRQHGWDVEAVVMPDHRAQRVLLIGCSNAALAVVPTLIARRMELTIVERDAERADLAGDRFPGALVRRADGADPELLRGAIEEDRIDTVIVLLPEAEKAILIAILAKSLGAAKVLVRCDEPGYSKLASRLGVDVVLSAKRAMADADPKTFTWITEAEVVSLINLSGVIGALEDALRLEFQGKAKNLRKGQTAWTGGSLNITGAQFTGAGFSGAKVWTNVGGR